MRLFTQPQKLSKFLKSERRTGLKIGFVPTMGFLHQGHLSLVAKAKSENDVVVVSIFVNPAQFGPSEDFKRYPRDVAGDKKLLVDAGVDCLFVPTQKAVYPRGFQKLMSVGVLDQYLCGPKRPGHFRGVATVVKRLFEMIEPDKAYFGQKDYQQVKVVESLVKRFKFPIQIRVCPIMREKDGLAMSSRNVYLTSDERKRALALHQSLRLAKRMIQNGVTNVSEIRHKMKAVLSGKVNQIDYAEVADSETLKPLRRLKETMLIAIACFVGQTRLIDNLLVKR